MRYRLRELTGTDVPAALVQLRQLQFSKQCICFLHSETYTLFQLVLHSQEILQLLRPAVAFQYFFLLQICSHQLRQSFFYIFQSPFSLLLWGFFHSLVDFFLGIRLHVGRNNQISIPLQQFQNLFLYWNLPNRRMRGLR